MKSSDAQPAPLPDPKQLPLVLPSADESASTSQTCDVNFATSGTLGIVDLGASQTVIGDAQVKDLVQNLPEEVQQQIQRTSCHLTFRFGNQQTLTSRHALLLPLGRAKFRIAVVPGRTPFLLSSSFLKGIKAVIDTDNGTMWSKTLNRELAITQSNKNLFLMDISQLWPTMPSNQQVQKSDATGFACQPVPIQNQAVAVWETSLDMSNMKHDDTVSHENHDCQAGEQVSMQVGSDEHPDKTVSIQNRNPSNQQSSNQDRVSPSDVPQIESCARQHVLKVDRVTETAPVPRGSEEIGLPGRDREDSRHDSGTALSGANLVWKVQDRPEVRGGLQGRVMDRLVCDHLREESQAPTSDVHSVRAQTSRPGHDAGVWSGVSKDPEARDSSQQSSQDSLGEFQLGSNLRSGCMPRVRDAGPHQAPTGGGTDAELEPGEPEPGLPHYQHRDEHAGASSSCASNECQERAVETAPIHAAVQAALPDLDFDFMPSQENQGYRTKIRSFVRQFSKELREVVQSLQNSRRCLPSRLDLLEVMCSEQSELTSQVRKLGGKAQRFGRIQGDLSTPEGRKKLFVLIATFRPKHVWISPECGPWCQWSQFNMNRSLQGWENVMEQRFQKLWQIALAIVLYQHQRESQSHFDLEQPRGSALLKTPGMSEILVGTLWNEFDMCRLGDLKDPQTQEPIRKRMTVCSTSTDLHIALHGKMCTGDHHHRPIAGNTKVHGVSVKLSQWTELYPQKFAKQVAKIILHDKGSLCETFVGETDEHPTKRRRLGSKLSPMAIQERFAQMPEAPEETWQNAMSLADQTAPRVGTQVIEQGPLIEMVQKLCSQHHIRHVVLCRGTDRYVGPNKRVLPGYAPLRRQVCIQRKTEAIIVDDWEAWENLSQKGLRKKGHSARVSMTVFADVRNPDVPTPLSNQTPVMPDPEIQGAIRRPAEDNSSGSNSGPESKRVRWDHATASEEHITDRQEKGFSKPQDLPDSSERHDEPSQEQHVIDLASMKHGPMFLQLTQEEQSWILKLHRNLGHPGHAKLKEFCRQLQCPEKIIQAIGDLKCSTCQELRGPTISRPSAIHEPCDFGEVVSMDGITWTNAQGNRFHFYHFLDQSTMFNTAVVSPGHTTEHACRALLNGWFQWAGPPSLLCVDAATELNSEEFSAFLQRHSTKCRTCAAEAHWQNARTERHGGIIQLMLNKVDAEQPINSYEQLSVALSHVTSTKNQWSRHRGFPPEMLVFGKGVRVPGSVTSDPTVAAHAMALSNQPDGLRFRQDLALCESARKAFAAVDNDQILRRALVHRSRPTRGFYEKGEWVMMWKKKGEAEGNWVGPLQVIIQEGQNVVWITQNHKLYRIAPEHLRSLSAMEEYRHQVSKGSETNQELASIRPNRGGVQFHDVVPGGLMPEPTARAGARVPETSRAEADGSPNNELPIQEGAPKSGDSSQQPDGEPEVTSIRSDSVSGDPPATQQEETSHIDIPVPETSEEDDDEGLYVDTYPTLHLQTEQAFRFEVDVNQRDIDHWKEETRPSEMAFLVSAAKRQRSEVKFSTLNTEERRLFTEAKNKEVESWLNTETVVKILRHQIPRENILRCRWILTWKAPEEAAESTSKSQSNQKRAKARLVVLGFEDPLVDQIPRDSPTMSKLSRVLILQHAASLGWDIHSFDIKTAFLRGTEQNTRTLGMEPPEEMRTKMRLKSNEIVQLLKGAYGRVDAPFLWFQELKQSLESLGFESAPFDPCCFVLRDKNHQPEGILGIHVDDGLCCGSARFHAKIAELERKYPFGSKKNREFTFTGLKISQKNDHSIWVNQEQYVRDISPIQISRERKQSPTAPVTEAERQSLRALVGSLQYAAVNTRPDVAARLGWLQTQINKATISTLLEGNKILHETKLHSDVTIKFQAIPIDDIRFVAFSDASFSSAKNPDSHQGMMIMSTHKSIAENKNCPVNPLVWHSKKVQKVVVSTLSAEAMSLAGAVDVLSWIRLYWAWIRDGRCQWQQADETLMRLPPAFAAIPPEEDSSETKPPITLQHALSKLPDKTQAIITTDCKSLFDLISRHAPPSCQEFRTQLQAKLIKEHFRNGIQIRWVPSQAQLADALTKIMDASILRERLARGRYSLHDEDQILRARSDSRARMQWLRNMSQDSKGVWLNWWKSQVVHCLQLCRSFIALVKGMNLESFLRSLSVSRTKFWYREFQISSDESACSRSHSFSTAAQGKGSGDMPVEGGIRAWSEP